MADEMDVRSFVLAFGEWVEACWFGEHEVATRRLEAVLGLPADVVLVGGLSLLGRLLETYIPAQEDDVAAALAHHLVVMGPDPQRESLIRDVVLAARSAPAAQAGLLARHGAEAVIVTALECASFLAQAEAERQGVVPSSILEGL
jgi:hypothetical protein